jgi:hypothetical protein
MGGFGLRDERRWAELGSPWSVEGVGMSPWPLAGSWRAAASSYSGRADRVRQVMLGRLPRAR